MESYNRELFIKILLILVSEGIAVIAVEFISKNYFTVPYTPMSSIFFGAILAVVTVMLYDKWIKKRRDSITRELKDLTDLALLRYDIGHVEERKGNQRY